MKNEDKHSVKKNVRTARDFDGNKCGYFLPGFKTMNFYSLLISYTTTENTSR